MNSCICTLQTQLFVSNTINGFAIFIEIDILHVSPNLNLNNTNHATFYLYLRIPWLKMNQRAILNIPEVSSLSSFRYKIDVLFIFQNIRSSNTFTLLCCYVEPSDVPRVKRSARPFELTYAYSFFYIFLLCGF